MSFSISSQSKARDLYEKELFLDAAVGFEYEIFQSEGNEEKNDLIFMKYLCYKSLGNYDKALATINRMRYVRRDSVRGRVGYEKALLMYLLEKPTESNFELQKIAGNAYNNDLDVSVLTFLVDIDQLHWEEARTLLKSDKVLNFTEEDIEIILPKKLKPKDVNKAENLSLIPGLGQWYAGYFWRGATSGIIQAGIGAFMVYSLIEGYVLSGTLTGAAGLYTFNLGGARHAGELAVKKNLEHKTGIKKRFFDRIKN